MDRLGVQRYIYKEKAKYSGWREFAGAIGVSPSQLCSTAKGSREPQPSVLKALKIDIKRIIYEVRK